MPIDATALDAYDRQGYTVLEAITSGGLASSSSVSHPHTFICIDGKTYWAKGNVQQGLVAELIAGRLAAKIGGGPPGRIIRVVPPVNAGLPPDLEGVIVGSEDQPGTVNARDLQPFIHSGQFSPGTVDPVSRARVVTFQTWVGVSDAQVLVRLTDGAVMSIDHGDCFGNLGSTALAVQITDIPGLAADIGKDLGAVDRAVSRIEAISERELIEAVTRIPMGAAWHSPVQRRIDIAQWLTVRQKHLRGVMEAWVQS